MGYKHTTLGGHNDPASISISRAEYNSLVRTVLPDLQPCQTIDQRRMQLRESREYELLKKSLFSGGITPETLALLISGAGESAPQNDNKVSAWADEDFDENPYGTGYFARNETSWKYGNSTTGGQALRTGLGTYITGQAHLRIPSSQPPHRQVSYGAVTSSVPEDTAYDEADSMDGSHMCATNNESNVQRTLYFTGFPARTTYRDLLSVIKGGKVLSVNLRSEKSATVTFLDAAADYLTWTKRNDIYLNSKRVDVRWADRQFRLNQHINRKVANGATRNLCIRGAASRGLSEQRIRDDMEHIHNLVIVDITYRNSADDAYISMNSVHNALFARTCMMSRSTYKGCKIEFYPDECDVPIPPPVQRPTAPQQKSMGGKNFETLNRFGMLGLDDGGSSDEENRGPITARVNDDDEEEDFDDEPLDWSRRGVSLG